MRDITGYTEWRGGMWKVQIYMPDHSRHWIPMPGIGPKEEPRAKLIGAAMARRAVKTGMVPTMRAETVNEYNDRWSDWRVERGLSAANESRRNICNHFSPKYGTLPVEAITKANLEDFVSDLDRRVREGEMAWKMAANVWSSVSAMFRDATNAKDRTLRIVEANPALGVAPPDEGDEVEKQFLYPNEFLQLVACEQVPLERAELYTYAVYTVSRAGEIVPNEWDDLDLDHGVINFYEAVDRVREPTKVKGTKTKVARRVTIEDNLFPVLVAKRKRTGGAGPLFDWNTLPRADGEYGLAGTFKKDLVRAGVTRSELHTRTRTQRPIRFHDLRATGITWMAIRGDDAAKIHRRAGHKSFQTTLGYIRMAEVLQEANFGDVFPELPKRLTGVSPKSPQFPKKNSNFSTNSWAQQDLNL